MKNLILGFVTLLCFVGTAAAEGDASAGKSKSNNCAACHAADGNSVMGTWPKLAGQGEKYLFKQMRDIKSGLRPVPTMAGQLDNMSEQDMRDIAAYYASQPVTRGAAKKELVEVGERLYRVGNAETGVAACAACHSPTGVGNAPAGFPAVGGQHAEYVVQQLKAFRDGVRVNDGDAKTMRDVAFRMNDKEIEAVSSYISGLH